MAKVSMIERERRRAQTAAKYAAKRAALKAVIQDRAATPEQIDEALTKLQHLPRDASPTRQQRRCRVSGRPHAVYRKSVMRGDVPGVVKASW